MKEFFYSEINHWNRLLRDMVESLSVKVFKVQVDRVLIIPPRCHFHTKGWNG